MTKVKLRRLTAQQLQENRSREQLAERFDEYGWLPEPITRDLGEDFLVRIYDEGVSSGLSFFVQLKSTQDLTRNQLRSGRVSYPFKVKDIEHWEASAVPVFLFVWDVNDRRGCWCEVWEAIRQLNDSRPNWRHQKTARVRMPQSNSTDDEGLGLIRRRVADHYYPVIARDKDLTIEVSLRFPATPEGQSALTALEQHFETGEIAEIHGAFIDKFKFSDWYARLFGDNDPSIGHLVVGPASSSEPRAARLDLFAENGLRASVPYIELAATRVGSKQITLSNQDQPIPYQLRFVFDRPKASFRMTVEVSGPGVDVEEAKDILRFMTALANLHRVRLTFLATQETVQGAFAAGSPVAPDPRLVEAVDKLCLIQQKTGQRLRLPQDWTITSEDLEAIDQIMTIIEKGRTIRHNQIATFSFKRYALQLFLEPHKAGELIRLKMSAPEGYVRLLGERVDVGPFTRYTTGRLNIAAFELEDQIMSMGPDDELEVKLVDAEVVEEFDDWPKSSVEGRARRSLLQP